MPDHHPFAGRIVRHRIAEIEKRMAAGEKISTAPTAKAEGAAPGDARERNTRDEPQ